MIDGNPEVAVSGTSINVAQYFLTSPNSEMVRRACCGCIGLFERGCPETASDPEEFRYAA